ncbi:endolytic transglycosylase MltG [Paenibacillus agilis]|uniref:Endolytic murein transglycosylase n=1 Tax=Paenibacillus agilis TaxID=3020863 RepID=A0A559J3K0_9BACL|nr:endolytic transglycosylase MltG [Paenibacillus agilis]TVX94457.1 endolytic transglycosylase MltG [Paenibacillus agilis]
MKSGLKIVSILFLAVLILAAGGGWYVWSSLQPVSAKNEEVHVKIESGTGPSTIAQQLEEQGLIKNATFFKTYLKWNGEGSKFKAGEYAFKPGMTYEEIIAKLNGGEVVKQEGVRFTIPEGFTIEQMADKLAKEGIVKKDEFLTAAAETAKLLQKENSTPFLIPQDTSLKHPLEGYLFPETYELKIGSTAQDIVNRMLLETENRLTQIPNWEQQLKERGLTVHELFTVASLVEREVVVDEERALVAGVIYNRIDDKMRLQIDATVQYALDKPKERLLYKDLEIDSPYNTYKVDKLPPGPIASPSLASLTAALAPEASEYLFYVTKKDGTSTHLFAKTYEDHQKNIEKSKKQ